MSKKRKKSSSRIFVVLFIIVISLYIYRYVFLSLDTEIVKYGFMEESFEAKGLIIRNEWVTKFSSDTEIKNGVEEGQRVHYGKKLVEIAKGNDVNDDLLSKIDKLEERISEISKDDNRIFKKDDELLSKNIDNNVEEIKRLLGEADLEALAQTKEKLSADLYKRSLITGEDSFSGKNLEALKQEKGKLERLYGSSQDVIYAKSAGVASYNIDGLEQSLNPLNIESFDIVDIKGIIESFTEDKRGNSIESGIKVVEGYNWYVCIVLQENQLKGLKEGNKVKIKFKGNEEDYINAKLDYISDSQENEYLVVFKTDEFFRDYHKTRVADIEIITKRYEGFLVSKESIVEDEKEKGIYIIKKGIVRFVPIEILSCEGDKVLIDNIEKKPGDNQTSGYIIKVYDEVVKNTKRIKVNQRAI